MTAYGLRPVKRGIGFLQNEVNMFDCYALKENNNIKDYCVQLKQAGFKGACFAEPVVFSGESVKKVTQKVIKDFEIRNILDISFDPDTAERIAVTVAGAGFDGIINSVTSVDGTDIKAESYYSSQPRNDAYNRYLQKVYDSLDAPYDFNALGPITMPQKFAYYPSPQILWREFPEVLDAILMRSVFMQKCITVDASGIVRLKSSTPEKSVLMRYKELGGELITVGSYNQQADVAVNELRLCYTALKEWGFEYCAVLHQGIPEMVKL